MDAPSNMSEEQRLAFYEKEISKRTPPKSEHDEFMLHVYQHLLDHASEMNAALQRIKL